MTTEAPDVLPPEAGVPNPRKKKAAPPEPVTWEGYLTGKKVAADRFLARITKGGISVPTADTAASFAQALREKPDRVLRIVALIQASAPLGDTVREIVLKLAEASLAGLDIGPLDAATFERTVLSWLRQAKKRPLPATELGTLFLLLQVGSQRRMVDEETVYRLLGEAVTRPAKPRTKQVSREQAPPNLLPPLLSADPAVAVLTPMLRVHQASAAEADSLRAEIRSRTAEVEQLVAARSALGAERDEARREIGLLRSENAAARVKIEDLEAKLVGLHDGYRHTIREMGERMIGVLGGQVTRWLRTGLAAARAEPPRVPVVEERLEDALTLIEKEIAWLQHSA
jgi:hypothetical protein